MERNKFGSLTAFSNPRTLVMGAMLIALNVILSRILVIQLPAFRLGIGFLPVAMFSMLYGPLPGAVAAALGDILGVLLFPAGAYLPGLTLSAFMLGLVFGLFLYNKELTVARVILCGIFAVIIGEGLSTLFLAQAFGFSSIIVSRLIQAGVKLVLEPVLIYTVGTRLKKRTVQ